jgi:hypothetical protein
MREVTHFSESGHTVGMSAVLSVAMLEKAQLGRTKIF